MKSRALCLKAFLLGIALSIPPLPAETVTIGIVRDGPAPGADVTEEIREELARHLPHGVSVTWKSDPAFDAGWDPDRARGALEAALADSEVAIVLAAGSIVTLAATHGDPALTKPVVSAFVQRSDLFPMPYREGQTLPENLSYTVIPSRDERDITEFRTLVPFDLLHVMVAATDLAVFGDRNNTIRQVERDLGINVTVVAMGAAVGADAFAEAQAVLLGRSPQLSPERRAALIAELGRRGIPTWSLLGHADVEAGALAALSPDTTDQVARRVALNLSRVLRGAATSELPVVLTVDSKLLINARTARQVGYVPDPERRLFASFLHPELLEDPAEALGLVSALQMAESGNTALSVEDAVLDSVRASTKIARSFLLPQIQANVAYRESDATIPIPPEGGRATLSLQQLLYDDRTRGASRSARHLELGAEHGREVTRLDVLARAGRAYFLLAQAQALYRVEVENLHLTEDFLELARLREEVGYSGRAEIVRWEATRAEQRSALFRAVERTELARIVLNQVLGVDQTRRFEPREVEIDPEVFPWLEGRLNEMYHRYAERPEIRQALVRWAIEHAPETAALREALTAQEIQLAVAQRRFYLPSFLADVSYSADLGGGGTNLFFDEDDSTTVTFTASYPVFEGGRRTHEVAKAEADRETLARQLALAEELVEQRTRTALRRVESSFPRLELSRQAADSADENLRLVQDQYVEGLVNVTDLFSAQTQSFAADQFATLALYEHLLDLIALERAIAWFSHSKTTGERDELVEWIRSEIGSP